MKLLIVTQTVDRTDTYLGFFHRWIEVLAQEFERVEVICLYEGAHALPENVRVHSLGKERGRKPSFVYAFRFLSYIWKLRKQYDAVFVHQNEEYMILGGLLWRVWGRRATLWRNHYAGSWKTRLAGALAAKVFYTSIHSYTARFRNAVQMPVGVDAVLFEQAVDTVRSPGSILFFARIATSKRPELFLDALGMLKERGIAFAATVAGDPLPEDRHYLQSLMTRAESLGIADMVQFVPGVPHHEVPSLFSRHSIFVNCAPSGMFDKMLFEAAAAGTLVLTTSDDFKQQAGEEFHFTDATELAKKLSQQILLGAPARQGAHARLSQVARQHALLSLAKALSAQISA